MSASSKKKLRKEQETAALTEKQQQEQKESKKLKAYTLTFVIVIALVLVIGLVTLVSGWITTSGIVERSTVALTVGDHDISSAELNYFYIDVINANYSNWYSTYGDYTSFYLSMMGLDLTQPLNAQAYSTDGTQTWADYFAEQAVDEAVASYVLCDLADKAGYKLTETDKTSVETAMDNMQYYADENNLSLKDYLRSFYGNGATVESYRKYLEVVALATSYELHIYDGRTYEQGTIDAFSEANFLDFTSFSYLTFQVNHNEFISQFCTADETDKEHTHTEEEKSAALKAAADAANALAEGTATDVVTLNKAIKTLDVYKDSESATASESHSVLYTQIANAEIAQWLAEDGRKAGDKTVIANTNSTTAEDGTVTTTPYAYTVVLFLERNDNTDKMVNVRHILKSFSNDPNATEFTDEQKANAKEFIENLQESWLKDPTEQNFSILAMNNSTDSGSKANGGLYTNVFRGQMVTNFNNWCFDESRKAGDYGIVESDFGYHLIYFVDHCDQTYRDYMIENKLRNDDHNAWVEEAIAAAKHSVRDTSKLSLDLILLRQAV